MLQRPENQSRPLCAIGLLARRKWLRGVAASAAVTILIGLVYAGKEQLYLALLSVHVRAPVPSDCTSGDYFGIWSDHSTVNNIAVISGPFSLETSICARLVLVTSGVVQEGNSFNVGRTRNWIGAPAWEMMNIRLALGRTVTSGRSRTTLGSAGQTWASSCASSAIADSGGKIGWALGGVLKPGKEYIVYIEGDQECIAQREMSLDHFISVNRGDYLIVLLKLDS